MGIILPEVPQHFSHLCHHNDTGLSAQLGHLGQLVLGPGTLRIHLEPPALPVRVIRIGRHGTGLGKHLGLVGEKVVQKGTRRAAIGYRIEVVAAGANVTRAAHWRPLRAKARRVRNGVARESARMTPRIRL